MTDETRVSPIPRERSPATMALDNLVRRKLRVSDPTNPTEIANALKSIYGREREALEQEAAGLPFVQVKPVRLEREVETSTSTELKQAKKDVDCDLEALIGNASLKDVQAELRGWAHAIRQIIASGVESARFALDPRQRDSAMAARRQLCGFARLARYVGALTPDLNLPYRQLAKSLDEVSAMVVVALGDAIANAGPGGARFLLQAPASELQSRRDSIIYALRNLSSTTAEGYGPNDWPRGLVAYRQFIARLEQSGHSDLRSLFQEDYVARALDELVHWSTSGSADDLRALASTAQLALERFRRLMILATRLVDPEAPPLAAYLSAIQLFLDGFEHGSSGARLLYLSRPPIVFYGLYGMSGLDDDGTKRLLQLVILRGQLAERLDCFLGCECGPEKVRCQIILDKLLHDVDRAVDLYALGTAGNGEPERRAAAYGVLIRQFLTDTTLSCLGANDPAKPALEQIQDLLWWKTPGNVGSAPEQFTLSDLSVLGSSGTRSPVKGFTTTDSFNDLGTEVEKVLREVKKTVDPDPPEALDIQDKVAHSELLEQLRTLAEMHQELCIQRSLDESWSNLLRTMAPSCIRFGDSGVLAAQEVLKKAILQVSVPQIEILKSCPSYEPDIPAHFETSLSGLTYSRFSEGGR